jgi:hypothetical protein
MPAAHELEHLGQRDPDAQDAADQLELIRYVLHLGASPEEVAAATNLGELALDLSLRPRGALALREVAEEAGLDWPTTVRLMTAVGLSTDPEYRVTADEAVLSPGAPSPGGHVPAQIAVRVAVLNPSTGAVVWSSVPLSGHIVMNPATGSIVSSDQAVLSPSGGSR